MHTTARSDEQLVHVPVDSVVLEGNLEIPEGATGIVVFVHGSGSSRHSPRNHYVAEVLRQAGLATLLFDLLTLKEEAIDQRSRHLRFDIDLLSDRVIATTDWLQQNPATHQLKVGYFGGSTGSAAALIAAAARPDNVHAVVSRGGRVDLAAAVLPQVQAPTLLIVGGYDLQVLRWNQDVLEHLPGPKHLEIVGGATHLFEETGKLEQVAELARDWFQRYLG
jgi:pimeloyl-ACP methyl ester carboxylesterase